MIRHTVLFKIKPNVGLYEVEKTLFEVHGLKNQLPGIISITAGKCHFHEQKSEQQLKTLFTHGFSIDFENQDSLDQFFNDPITHPLKDKIRDSGSTSRKTWF